MWLKTALVMRKVQHQMTTEILSARVYVGRLFGWIHGKLLHPYQFNE